MLNKKVNDLVVVSKAQVSIKMVIVGVAFWLFKFDYYIARILGAKFLCFRGL